MRNGSHSFIWIPREGAMGARFHDWFDSLCRRSWKTVRMRFRWGSGWRDKVRPGRRFTRVEYVPALTVEGVGFYNVRKEPGWEWWCPQCHTHSVITESMMPAILKEWETMAQNTVARGYKPPIKPTAPTAGCTNCRYRPGDPE